MNRGAGTVRHACRSTAIAFGLAVLCAVSPAFANLLSNGDFSQWDDDSTPSSWTVEDRNYALVDREDGQGHSSPPCLKLTRLQAGTGNNKGVLQNVPVTAGLNYTVAAWMMVPTMPDTMKHVGGRVILTWRNSSGLSIGSTNPSYMHDPAWSLQTYVAAAPNNPNGDSVAASADVLVRCYSRSGSTAGGIVLVDDVTFDQGGAVSERGLTTPLLGRFSVGPSPQTGDITISLELARGSDIRLRICDLAGSVRSELFSGKLSSGQHTFAAASAGLPEGLYFVTLSNDAGDIGVRKIVVQR